MVEGPAGLFYQIGCIVDDPEELTLTGQRLGESMRMWFKCKDEMQALEATSGTL